MRGLNVAAPLSGTLAFGPLERPLAGSARSQFAVDGAGPSLDPRRAQGGAHGRLAVPHAVVRAV